MLKVKALENYVGVNGSENYNIHVQFCSSGYTNLERLEYQITNLKPQ